MISNIFLSHQFNYIFQKSNKILFTNVDKDEQRCHHVNLHCNSVLEAQVVAGINKHSHPPFEFFRRWVDQSPPLTNLTRVQVTMSTSHPIKFNYQMMCPISNYTDDYRICRVNGYAYKTNPKILKETISIYMTCISQR